MLPIDEQQAANDREHLRLPALFWRIYGGILCVAPLCFLPHLLMAPMFFKQGSEKSPMEAEMMANILRGFAICGMIVCVVLAVVHFMAAKRLDQRKGWLFVVVLAAIDCMNAPFGMVLGIFTLIV